MVIKKLSTLTKNLIWRLESKCMQLVLFMLVLSSSGSGKMCCVHFGKVHLMLILGFTSVSAVDIDL